MSDHADTFFKDKNTLPADTPQHPTSLPPTPRSNPSRWEAHSCYCEEKFEKRNPPSPGKECDVLEVRSTNLMCYRAWNTGPKYKRAHRLCGILCVCVCALHVTHVLLLKWSLRARPAELTGCQHTRQTRQVFLAASWRHRCRAKKERCQPPRLAGRKWGLETTWEDDAGVLSASTLRAPFKSRQIFRCDPSASSSSAPLSKLLTSLKATRVTDRLNLWLMWWLFGGRISKNIHHNFPTLTFIRAFFCSVNRRKPRMDSVYDDSRPIDFCCRIISVPSTLSVSLSVCVRDKTYQWNLITFFLEGYALGQGRAD